MGFLVAACSLQLGLLGRTGWTGAPPQLLGGVRQAHRTAHRTAGLPLLAVQQNHAEPDPELSQFFAEISSGHGHVEHEETEAAAAASSAAEEDQCIGEQALAIGCLVSGVLDPTLSSTGSADEVDVEAAGTTILWQEPGASSPLSLGGDEVPLASPIDPTTGLLPEGIELPVPVPAAEPTIELPSLADPRTTVPTLRELAAFCLPTLGIWLSSPLLSLIDTSVVGTNCATHHLAALAPSTKVCDYVAYFCSVIGIATTNLAADAFARGEPATAKRVIGGSLTLSLTIGMLVSALVYTSAGPVMTAMLGGGAAPAAVASAATEYTSIRALGYPAALLTMTLQAAFIAMQDSRSPLLAIPLVACANLIGDLLLVKPLGAAGAAWATTVALYINAAALLAMWRRKVQTIGGRHVLFAVPTKREARRLLGFAAPMIVALSARVCLGLSITLSAVAIGTTALAANQIIESLYWLFCPFGEAISLSMQAFLPPLLLKGRSLARRLQCTAFRVAGVLGAAAGGFALLLPLAVPGVFTTSAVVASSAQLSAPFLGFSLFSFVFLAATEGMLIARKELRPLAASHVVNTLLFGALLYYASHTPGCALHHIWALLGVCNLWRVFQFRFLLDREDRAALAERSREPRRWRRALRALRLRLAIRRRRRREEVHEVIPDVEEIAPHLF